MEFKKITLSELKHAAYNPRKRLKPEDPEYQKIKRSIEEFGYVEPIIVNSDHTIIGGHQRANVLADMGYTEAECIIVSVDKTKEKALNIALNKISGEWDMEKLSDLMNDLDGQTDLLITGFDDDEIEDLLASLEKEMDSEEDDFAAEEAYDEISEPITKLGDVWLLGEHRLMCGDSTDPENVKKLMAGKKAEMLLTDPPYNVALGSHDDGKHARQRHRRTDGLVIQNDDWDNDEDFIQFIAAAMKSGLEVMREGAAFYIWHADTQSLNFRKACKIANMEIRQCLIWKKNAFTLSRQDYQWIHEPCLYGWKAGAAHTWTSDRKQSTVLEFDKPTRSAEHPTMKPVALFDYQIKNNSHKGDIILDLFGGSGTTIIACEQNERKGYLMELDPKFCDVIVKRWEELTGEEAVREEA